MGVERSDFFKELYTVESSPSIRALKLSYEILDQKGNLVAEFEDPDYLAPPDGHNDHLITDHFRRVLAFLRKNRQALAPFSLPVCGEWIEEVICRTLGLTIGSKLTSCDVKRAVLVSLLTPLRQKIGSCFASAPAILIQKEQHENFLADLLQLLTRGKLGRVIDGVEYTVPVNPSKNSLLRVWEYTLASLSDLKHEFYKWNLFASLGFDMNEKGGIGELIANHLNAKIARVDEEVEKHRQEAILAGERARMTESLMKSADTVEKARRLKNEHIAHVHHLRASKELFEEGIKKGDEYKKLFNTLIDYYTKVIPHYFQEVYDPEMFEVAKEVFEDSPAGFRLVYKYGRADPSQWKPIRNENEYIEALCDFFHTTEMHEEEVGEITTKIIHHLRSNAFLIPALQRVAALHKKAGIDSKKQEKKKPWSYISGGSMVHLLKCYYGREAKIHTHSHTPENALDLVTFLIDFLKNHPKPDQTFLMHSPGHAFTLRPDYPFFAKAWKNTGFTYTWVRDEIVTAAQSFYNEIRLARDEQEFVLHALGMQGRGENRDLSIKEFAEAFLVTGDLRSLFPLIPASHWPGLAHDVLTDMMAPEGAFAVLEKYREGPEETLTQKTFINLILAALYEGSDTHIFAHPPYIELKKTLEKRKLIPPPGLVFADTNWPEFSFGVVYNPATEEAELWRMDALGMTGIPMNWWGIGGEWTIYTNPSEYSSLTAIKPHHKKV